MPDTETILTIIFCIVDDLVKQCSLTKKPGAVARFTDSELIALLLYKEMAGIESERQIIRMICRDFFYLFPQIIGQSQFNRRAKALSHLIEKVRQDLLRRLNAYLVEFTVIDSTSVPIKHAVRAARTHAEKTEILGYGRNSSTKRTTTESSSTF